MYSSESAGPSADVGFRWADLACSCIFTDPYVRFLFFLFAHLNQQIGGSETWGSSLNIRLFCSQISTWRKWRNVKHQYTLVNLIVSDTIRDIFGEGGGLKNVFATTRHAFLPSCKDWKISNWEFLMDTNSTSLSFISKQVESIDFQSKLLDYVFIF